MTQKLYYEDVYRREFEAAVVFTGKKDGRPFAVLNATCFYPEGGGQGCDTGLLGDTRVVDVQEEEGEIRHYLAVSISEGAKVAGKIDWQGRFHRMQQHLGQHILSAVVKSRHNGNSVGVHFGDETNTLDFDIPLTAEELAAVELTVNEIIHQNLAVRTSFPPLEEIREKSRKAIPDSEEPIRIVEIEDVDYIACCGTHPAFTGEVGLVKIFKHEAYKGGVRLFFSCGMAALQRLSRVWAETAQMQRSFSIGDGELPVRVEKLIDENKELIREKQALVTRLMELEAKRLRADAVELDGRPLIAGIVEAQDAQELKALFDILVREPAVLLLGGALPKGGMLLFGCHRESVQLGLKGLFQEAITLIGGKGGGSDVFSQGMSPGADGIQLEAAVKVAKDRLLTPLA